MALSYIIVNVTTMNKNSSYKGLKLNYLHWTHMNPLTEVSLFFKTAHWTTTDQPREFNEQDQSYAQILN